MDEKKGVNREYKDRLFKFIFCNPENKEWTLSLYNAVNGSSYTDTEDLTYTTLEDAVYMSMKNDVSFLMADDTMNFYEQQSTFNPNMPMRFLIYAGMVYSKYIEENKNYRKYSKKQQTAPTPKCVCFYNGTTKKEDKVILKLSDSFKDNSTDIEVTVTMLNINYGHNNELIKACKPLEEYAWFIDKIRLIQNQGDSLESAIDIALDELSDDSLIKQFLIDNRAEVKRMCITEYDEERTFAEQREEGYEEGVLDTLIGLVKQGALSLPFAAEQAKMTVDEFKLRAGLSE
ncbi:MAG: hypothetical protein K2K06_05090 [Oscillospiraceae bacterium]|nr:hypothetical protein [Oscillospiraceae bacterium]